MRLRNLYEADGKAPRVPSNWDVDLFSRDDDENVEYGTFWNDSEDVMAIVHYDGNRELATVEVVSGFNTSGSSRTRISQYEFDTNGMDYRELLSTVSKGIGAMRKALDGLSIGDIYGMLEPYTTVKGELGSAMDGQLKGLGD